MAAVKNIVVLGAGGQAREIAWLIRELNRPAQLYNFLGFVVTDLSQLGPRDSRDQVLGDYGWLGANSARVDALAVGIGSPRSRLKVVDEVRRILPDAAWPALVHPDAALDAETAQISEGAQICAGFTGTVNLRIGPFALCNFGCLVGHEAVIGRGSVINPGAFIGGGVQIGTSVLVGAGANILQYLRVGDGATVGAGAVVTQEVLPGTTVVGVPAETISR